MGEGCLQEGGWGQLGWGNILHNAGSVVIQSGAGRADKVLHTLVIFDNNTIRYFEILIGNYPYRTELHKFIKKIQKTATYPRSRKL